MAESFLNALAGGYQFGAQVKQGRDRQQLNALAGQAYNTAPEQQQGLLSQMAGIDPGTAQAQHKQFQSDEDRRNTTMANMARMLTTAPEQARAGLYQRMLPSLQQFGMSGMPEAYTPETEGTIMQAAQSIAQATMGSGAAPSGLREFQGMTQGLGADDVMKARRIALGLDGRASSAGFSQLKFTGPDGRERVGSFNGKTGQIDTPDGNSFNPQTGTFSRTEQGSGQPAPMEQVQYATSDGRPIPPEDYSAVQAAMQASARGEDVNIPAGGAPQSMQGGGLPPRLDYENGGNLGAFVGRAPEDQAAATEAAKIRAQLQYLPEQQRIEAEGAANKKRAELGVQGEFDKMEAMPKARAALQSVKAAGVAVNRAIDQALPNVSVWTAGTLGQPLSRLGGSQAANLRSALDTIEANLAFDRLQQMRNSSPTGGALGSVSERELTLLGAAMTSLKQSQSPEQLASNLTFLKQQYGKTLLALEAAYQADFGGQPAQPTGSAGWSIEVVP